MCSRAAERRLGFSSSELQTALTCPRLFWFGRVEGRDTLLGDPAACGAGRRVHRLIAAFERAQPSSPALERALERHRRDGALAPVTEALQELLYRRALVPELRALHDSGGGSGEQVLALWTALRDYAEVLAPVLAANARAVGAEHAVARTLLATELPVADVFEIPGGRRCTVRGRLDTIWYDHVHERALLLEFKTRPAAGCGEDALQLAIYHQLLRRTRGIVARGLIAWLGAEAPQPRTRTYGRRELQRLWDETRQVHLPHLLSWYGWRADRDPPLPGPRQRSTCERCPVRAACWRRFGPPLAAQASPPVTATEPSSPAAAADSPPSRGRGPDRSEPTRTRDTARSQRAQPRPSPPTAAAPRRVQDAAAPPGGGVLRVRLGRHRQTGEPIEWRPNDTRRTPHPNLGILGTMGTGKTQCTRSVVKQLCDAQRAVGGEPLKVLIFDYNGDYTDPAFVEASGAELVELYELPFNPLAIVDRRQRQAPLHRADVVVDSLARTHRLGAVQRNRLRDAILAAYGARGIAIEDPASWSRQPPTLHEVAERLFGCAPRKDSLYTALRQLVDHRLFAPDPAAAQGVWERVRGVVVFDLRRAADALRNLAIACVLDLFYAEMVAQPHAPVEDGARRLRAFVLVDEADNFLQQRFAVLRKLLKEGRKYGVGTILSTQFLEHFATPRENYHQAIGSWILHRLDSVDRRALRRAFSRFGTRELAAMAQQLGRLGPHESLALLPGPEAQPVPMRDLPFHELVATSETSRARHGGT